MDKYIYQSAANIPGYAYCMHRVLAFIQANPGLTKADIERSVGGGIGRNHEGWDAIDRLARRGLVYNLGRSNRHAWYAWQEPVNDDRPAGMWAPAGHP